jgi:TPR repeat protein
MSQRAATQAAHAQTRIPAGIARTDDLFQLGIMCSTGAAMPADMVAAHKWFNLAAMRGNAEAARLRREIADEMSEAEIAAAQRAARDWITRH